MIYNLKELQKYQLDQGEEFNDDIFKNGFNFASININQKKIKESLLQANINMPESYLDVISKYNVAEVDIGYFNISPSFRPTDIVEDLIFSNRDEGELFFLEFSHRLKIYYIASFDSDHVFIASKESKWPEGEILFIEFYDLMDPTEGMLKPIAKDFEQFLIAAGNLNLIHCLISDDLENEKKHIEEFCNTLKKLGMEDRYIEVWERFF